MGALNQRQLRPGERIRVMAVDDSVVIRRMLTRALEQDPIIEVVGTASNGAIGLERIPQLNPDVITLDIEMPDMDGLEMLRRIRSSYPHIRVIMFSTLTERGAAITLEALTIGADDYLAKFSREGSLDLSMGRLSEEMIPKIKQFFSFADSQSDKPHSNGTSARPRSNFRTSKSLALKAHPVAIVAIGVSTGGPSALSKILPLFPVGFPAPIVVVQHMPALFTRLLAERLNSICLLPVQEGIDGAIVERGRIFIAPGDFHMRVNAAGADVRIGLDQSPRQNSCRPAVDALFISVADVYGAGALAVVLTGMGQDGLVGSKILRANDATIFAQDEESSVVWGMPGAIVNAGIADRILPLDHVVPEILRAVVRN